MFESVLPDRWNPRFRWRGTSGSPYAHVPSAQGSTLRVSTLHRGPPWAPIASAYHLTILRMETTSIGIPKYAFAKFLSSFEVEELITDVTEEWQLSDDYAKFHERLCPADKTYGESVVSAFRAWLDKRDAEERLFSLESVKSDESLAGDVAAFAETLQNLGFGSDEEISGADAVDCINDNLELIRRLVSRLANAPENPR